MQPRWPKFLNSMVSTINLTCPRNEESNRNIKEKTVEKLTHERGKLIVDHKLIQES